MTHNCYKRYRTHLAVVRRLLNIYYFPSDGIEEECGEVSYLIQRVKGYRWTQIRPDDIQFFLRDRSLCISSNYISLTSEAKFWKHDCVCRQEGTRRSRPSCRSHFGPNLCMSFTLPWKGTIQLESHAPNLSQPVAPSLPSKVCVDCTLPQGK